MSANKVLYHTCFTRNENGTRILIKRDNAERHITGMTEDSFWDRKLYSELKRDRLAKKADGEHIKRQKSKKYIFLCNKTAPNF